MGGKNLVMLKTHIESINSWFVNDFVIGNMLWALASLRVFFFNYVLYAFELILRYIFRFQVENHADSNGFQDSEIDGFSEELANLIFPSSEDYHLVGKKFEGETESSVFMETNVSDIPEDAECSVLMETGFDNQVGIKNRAVEAECSVSEENNNSDIHEAGKESEGEKRDFNFMETSSDVHKDVTKTDQSETEYSVLMEICSDIHEEEVKKTDENETECSVFMEDDSIVHQHGRKREEGVQDREEHGTKGHVLMDTDSSLTTSKNQLMPRKDISVFIEEPTSLTFSFLEFLKVPNVPSISDNAFAITEYIPKEEISEGLVAQEEEEDSVQEQRNLNSGRFRFECETEVSGGNGSDSDYYDFLFYNNNSLASDSESESSNNSNEGFDYTNVRVIKEGSNEELEETQFSCDVDTEKEDSYRVSRERTEETNQEDKFFDELDSDEEDEDDYEWEDDETVEQLRLELRNARQGGLATILEEDEAEEEETESPKVVGDLKPLKIKDKVEYKDHIVEIQKVYKCYAEKMRKLEILNYQTMHAIGLLQLKDPLKLIIMPKSTVQGAKPLISQNLWPRKAPKHTSDPMLKFVNELHRDLELVYVGQVCLSWEILCWQHKKSQELQQYDSPWPHRYNLVAGEFQLFQVLIQRFIENEPFQQGPRVQNYTKNCCVIRNLLHVPSIKDDIMKDKKITKWGSDEDAIASGRLEEIIKESMKVFWDFVRADKICHQIGSDVKDPEISDLVVDIRTQLHQKERKLKDIVRSGNCLVRRFQKHNEEQVVLDHEQLLAQVGLRLISRVVNMNKLRKDQLLWCNEKLSRIKIVGRKVEVEPSFLLFPC